MQFIEGGFYHVYNRGNNQQAIFFQERNYSFFLEKVEKYLVPKADLIAWCLMPNHFHFLVRANRSSMEVIKHTPIPINALTESFRLMLSSYTKAIQKQQSFSGNLFQQKTKFKEVNDYLTTAFHYIHQNPFRAKLSPTMEAWKWSSVQEYLSKENRKMCNLKLAHEYVEVNWQRFLEESYEVIPVDIEMKLH